MTVKLNLCQSLSQICSLLVFFLDPLVELKEFPEMLSDLFCLHRLPNLKLTHSFPISIITGGLLRLLVDVKILYALVMWPK